MPLYFPTDRPSKIATGPPPIDDSFPEEAANELSTLESFNKHLYRPNTYLHKWWARRSGSTFRHILKQLVSDPERRGYYEAGGLEGRVILDPMMGGGTTLHEAIRMGANVLGVDIDPIPVLQTRASLTLSSLAHKETVFKKFFEELKKSLAPLYETVCPTCDSRSETQFLLYGLRRKCPCREVIVVDDFILRKSNHHDVKICHECHSVHTNVSHICLSKADRLLVAKGSRYCENCNGAFEDLLDEPFFERYVPLAVAGNCQKHKQFFKTVDADDIALIREARKRSRKVDLGDLKKFRIDNGPKSDDLIKRGVVSYHELFTPRQIIYLALSRDLLFDLKTDDRLWLALLISTSLEFNSILCGYKGRDIRRPGAIRHVFSHHAYSFPYTSLENNPTFSGNTSGTLNRLFNDRVVRAGKWAIVPIETQISNGRRTKVAIHGEIDGGKRVSKLEDLREGNRKFLLFQKGSADVDIPEGLVDYVVTDPPYYDNVQYSNLSSFFRVWLRLLLPRKANWNYNPLDSAVSEGHQSGARKYGKALTAIWKMCHRALDKEHGRLIFTFHHWNDEAWSELTLALKEAKFVLVNRYVVHSENPISVHIRYLNALKHDTILVLRPFMDGSNFPNWPEPLQIETQDSYSFCRDCGEALGYFLNSQKSEQEIRSLWKILLRGEMNGKASG